MDGRPNRRNKALLSNSSGLVCTGGYVFFSGLIRKFILSLIV